MSEGFAIRRDKRTPSENLRHVLVMGGGLFMLISLLWPSAERVFERWFMPPEPLKASLELIVRNGQVYVNYSANPEWAVNALWIGQLRGASNQSLTPAISAPKRHRYSANVSETRDWTWAAWWENPVYPPVPKVPFKICVKYEGVGMHGQTPFDTGYQCSDLFFDHLQEASNAD